MIFVYSIESYCVLKMSDILKFSYLKKGRMRLTLLKEFTIFMDMMQYQKVWYKASLSIFDLEILTSKILEKSTKSCKI